MKCPAALWSKPLDVANMFVGPLQRVRPRYGIFVVVVVVLVLVVPLRSEFIGEL